MRNREIASGPTPEAGRRHISVMVWVSAVALSFALGSLVTHFAFFGEPLSQFSFQAFFVSPFWSIASTALVCFVLGIGFAYVPFSWYREDANRALKTEYRDLRSKAGALRERANAERPSQPLLPIKRDETPEPDEKEQDEGPPDIAAVISEMSAAIKANLRDAGTPRPVDVDLKQVLRSMSAGK